MYLGSHRGADIDAASICRGAAVSTQKVHAHQAHMQFGAALQCCRVCNDQEAWNLGRPASFVRFFVRSSIP